jgi:glycosyltransferase involved in cell wall biosynthesis
MEIINPDLHPGLVTVCIITYNQVDYVVQAIESVLMQETNFPFNVVIADDCSKDGTAEIVRSYAIRNPGKLTAILQNPNVGAGSNYDMLIRHARGKYIAYLEGDDYWTDTSKLQLQIDVLESQADIVSCFSNVLELFDEDESHPQNHLQNGCWPKTRIGFRQIIHRNYIQTCSVVFRNHLVSPLPEWLIKLKVGDWPLHVLLSQFGDFYYIHRPMAAHRNHSSGLWSRKSKLARIEATIEAYHAIARNTPLGTKTGFKQALSNTLLSSVKYCMRERFFAKAMRNFASGFLLYPLNLFTRKIP